LRSTANTEGRALLIPLENPEEVILGEKAGLGNPICVMIDGLGIRAIAYLETPGKYLVTVHGFKARPGATHSRILSVCIRRLVQLLSVMVAIIGLGQGFKGSRLTCCAKSQFLLRIILMRATPATQGCPGFGFKGSEV
jgi:hypothetical protein